MPQLRWTLLFLGVVFVILLAWIERRRQRQQGQGFSDSAHVEKAHVEKEPAGESTPASLLREPAFALPEMRAAREPAPPHDLPVVEIEDESLDLALAPVKESRPNPPTLSLPVVGSNPELARRRGMTEPTLSESGLDSLEFTRTDVLADPPDGVKVPRLDKLVAKPVQKKIELADTHVGIPAAPQSGARPPDGEERAFNDAVFGEASLAKEAGLGAMLPGEEASTPQRLSSSEPDFTDAELGAIAAEAEAVEVGGSQGAAVPVFTAADVKPVVEPLVEWPPDDQRRVVALRLVAPPPERLAGRALRLALASEGFVLGKFQIFHKPDESGRAVLSAANLSKPGTFDLGTMDTQRYGGLSLFAVLPGPKPSQKAFDDLLVTARNLNERLQGALQDERGGPLTPTRIASMRDSLDAEAS